MPGGATEDELVEQLEERGVTGIVFLSGLHADTRADPTRYARLASRGVPFVLINGYNDRIDAPFVSPDDGAASRMAVRHLAELGHERIGLAVGPARYVPSRRKADGFVAALAESFGLSRGRPNDASSTRCSASRAATRQPRRCSTRAVPASSAAVT